MSGSEINYGADVTSEPHFDRLLIVAINSGNGVNIIDLMLQHGADPNRSDLTGKTPLIAAVLARDPAIVRCLLHYHAYPNDTAALDYAEQDHLPEIAKLLRDSGARQ